MLKFQTHFQKTSRRVRFLIEKIITIISLTLTFIAIAIFINIFSSHLFLAIFRGIPYIIPKEGPGQEACVLCCFEK